MATFSNGESGASVRAKINAAITAVDDSNLADIEGSAVGTTDTQDLTNKTVNGRNPATDGAKLDAIDQGLATTDSPTFANLTLTGRDLMTSFATRAALVAAWSDGLYDDGTVLSDGVVFYKASSGATDISDLPGLVPFCPVGFADAFPNHFGPNTTEGVTDMTAEFQAAIDYCAAIGSGTFGQGGVVGLLSQEYKLSDTDADGYCVEIGNSVSIRGQGWNSSTIYVNTTDDTVFYIGKGNTAILADTAGTAVVDGVKLSDFQIYNTSSSVPTAGAAISVDRSVAVLDTVRTVNHYRGVEFLGVPESCVMRNCQVTAGSNVVSSLDYDAEVGTFTAGETLTGGTSGATAYIVSVTDNGTTGTLFLSDISGTFQNDENITDSSTGDATADGTVQLAEDKSAGIAILRRQINATYGASAGYQDSGDSNYYIECNSVYLTDNNIRLGALGYQHGGEFSLLVGACDGLFAKGNHFSWGTLACIGFCPQQDNIGYTNINIHGGLVDPLPRKSSYGVLLSDEFGVTNNQAGTINLDGVQNTGANLDGVRIEWQVNRFLINGGEIKNAKRYGLYVANAGANDVKARGVEFYDLDSDGTGTDAAIYIAGSNRTTIHGCGINDSGRGIQITTGAGRCSIRDNTFENIASGVSIFLQTGITGIDRISGNAIDESTTVASAGTIALPVGADTFYITGTTTITTIQTASPTSTYDGREVTLIFAASVTLNETGNLDMGGTINAAATDVLRLIYNATAGKWLKIAHSVN